MASTPESFDSNALFAFLTLAGFGVQRTLELLDLPITAITSKGWLGQSAADTKKGLTAWLGFVVGIVIAYYNPQSLPHVDKTWSTFIVGLAIGTGTNAVNSLLKYAEYAKGNAKQDPGAETPAVPVLPGKPAAPAPSGSPAAPALHETPAVSALVGASAPTLPDGATVSVGSGAKS